MRLCDGVPLGFPWSETDFLAVRVPGSRIYASTLGESLFFPSAIEAEKNGVLPVALGQSGEGHKKAAIFKEMAAFRI